jgi:hypothetical protein
MNMKPGILIFKHKQDGTRTLWKFHKDTGYNRWALVAPDGYTRFLEDTWVGSVPRIKAIADNHGCTVEVS